MSEYFAEEFLLELFGARGEGGAAEAARGRFARERRRLRAVLGPVCGPRQVFDLVALPLAAVLGFDAVGAAVVSPRADLVAAPLGAATSGLLLLVATGWGQGSTAVARHVFRLGCSASARWCLCTDGEVLRLFDTRQGRPRRFAQIDLDAAAHDEAAFRVLWTLVHRSAFERAEDRGAPIDQIVDASDRNTVGVCRSLQDGVLDALASLLTAFVASDRQARGPLRNLDAAHEQALTIIYRILFLLFAESRRLVPTWHPIYRDSYSLDAARQLAERRGPATGLWETLQAIARLAHGGCRAADLQVTPFNGRLFSPTATPIAEQRRIDDETARRLVLALSTTPRPGGCARIVYRDLGVEQLGAVYESVLDYRPRVNTAPSGGSPPLRAPEVRRRRGAPLVVRLEPGSTARKSTASFYTPRPVTSYLVGRTLGPLVNDAAPERILGLRVLDPAMGSGAFLVAACGFLASAYEAALVRTGACHAGDIDEADRHRFRRSIAQRCLYGVDLNPMAVQLARLSLWLATLAPDRPLTFLDHRLMVGDSLVGASIDDVLLWRCGTKRPRHPPRSSQLPLFEADGIGPDVRAVLPGRIGMAEREDDALATVREKERLLSTLAGPRSPLARWKAVLDLWCAQASEAAGRGAGAGVFHELADLLLAGRTSLDEALAARLVSEGRSVAATLRPFHWTLEFPEVFFDADGAPSDTGGFDAIVGNPPWDMMRSDTGTARERAENRESTARFQRFARHSGVYRAQGEGHGNRFQLFVERAVRLARRGGRLGLVVPWGLLSDHGCASLRRLLFDRTIVDVVTGFENANRIFPIHRSVRFIVLTATGGGRTTNVALRLGERDVSALEGDGAGEAAHRSPVVLSRSLLERLSGPDLAVPDIRRPEDLAVTEKLARAAPPLSDPAGWHADFGRELNATDDRRYFTEAGHGLPVLEGKHVEPFRVVADAAVRAIPEDAAARVLDREATFAHARLGYRDVACATNRLTLIAAIVPAGCVTVHTLFCLRTRLPTLDQFFLCGILNSFVANYAVRLRVSTHVTTAITARLPVPRPARDSARFQSIAGCARHLTRVGDPLHDQAYPRLQALVATLYGLTADELDYILGTFPLIEESIKDQTRAFFQTEGPSNPES